MSLPQTVKYCSYEAAVKISIVQRFSMPNKRSTSVVAGFVRFFDCITRIHHHHRGSRKAGWSNLPRASFAALVMTCCIVLINFRLTPERSVPIKKLLGDFLTFFPMGWLCGDVFWHTASLQIEFIQDNLPLSVFHSGAVKNYVSRLLVFRHFVFSFNHLGHGIVGIKRWCEGLDEWKWIWCLRRALLRWVCLHFNISAFYSLRAVCFKSRHSLVRF